MMAERIYGLVYWYDRSGKERQIQQQNIVKESSAFVVLCCMLCMCAAGYAAFCICICIFIYMYTRRA